MRRGTDENHSSSPAITGGIKRPTRRLRTGSPITPPYLALLRAGFCLPPVLPRARCALTAPFHPYSPSRPSGAPAQQALEFSDYSRACRAEASKGREGGRYIFCATFLQVTLTGRYPAHCPMEFGLSSRLRAHRALRRARPASARRDVKPLCDADLSRRSVRRTRRRTIVWPPTTKLLTMLNVE